MSKPPHQCPGSDIRIVLRGLVYECQNQRDTGKYKFSGAFLGFDIRHESSRPNRGECQSHRTSVPVLTFVSCCGGLFTNVRTKGTLASISFLVRFLDLTFAMRVRGQTGANVKATAPVSRF